MFVLFCACDVMNVLSVKKNENLPKKKRKKRKKKEMFIGWSYTRFLFLALIRNPTWLSGPIMCSDWSKGLKIFLLETTKPIEL